MITNEDVKRLFDDITTEVACNVAMQKRDIMHTQKVRVLRGIFGDERVNKRLKEIGKKNEVAKNEEVRKLMQLDDKFKQLEENKERLSKEEYQRREEDLIRELKNTWKWD